MRLTTAKYYLPSGRTIHGVGVTPDIVVDPGAMKTLFKMKELKEVTEDAAKSGLDAKVGEKEESALSKTEEMKKMDPELQLQEKDVQLKRAIELLKGMRVFNKLTP